MGWGIPSTESIKMVSASIAALTALATGYVTLDGPIPATRQWVQVQNEQVKSRLIDNSLQVNRLELELLHREQFDRQIQIQKEDKPEIRSIYQERLNAVLDSIASTVIKNQDLVREKQSLTQAR